MQQLPALSLTRRHRRRPGPPCAGNTALSGQYLPIVPYKLVHAAVLADLGLLQQASAYCAALSATLQVSPATGRHWAGHGQRPGPANARLHQAACALLQQWRLRAVPTYPSPVAALQPLPRLRAVRFHPAWHFPASIMYHAPAPPCPRSSAVPRDQGASRPTGVPGDNCRACRAPATVCGGEQGPSSRWEGRVCMILGGVAEEGWMVPQCAASRSGCQALEGAARQGLRNACCIACLAGQSPFASLCPC